MADDNKDAGAIGTVHGKVKESSSKDDLEYKGWLKIYKKSPDAAESHAKHKQFLARYKKEQKK